MSTENSVKIAVVGAGAAGCYLAQALQRSLSAAEIVIFDRYASPFGLIRYGVAADHQHTKAITRQFERMFRSPDIRFAGGVHIGEGAEAQLSVNDLAAQFDAVVLATGRYEDRPLGVLGEELQGVFGAGAITRRLNSAPNATQALDELGDEIVIVGAGNVAMDVLRFLAKPASLYAGSDIDDEALEEYARGPAKRVTVLSRSSAAKSAFDPQMLKEIIDLDSVHLTAYGVESPDGDIDARGSARLELVGSGNGSSGGSHDVQVDLHFGAEPVELLGDARVTGVALVRQSERVIIDATSVITAIGFELGDTRLVSAAWSSEESTDASVFEPSDSGKVAPGVYRTGWLKRGATGGVPENRACAKSVAAEIEADLQSGELAPRSDKAGWVGLPADVRELAVSYSDWLRLDEHERAGAGAERVRRKVKTAQDMIRVARGASS
ncbi:ferredoxin--NADP+ reductase [Leucobacter exalbidus]|uniref:ferredoxin--NADP(+) reductase n=1 Tax=Leucobacter exalbidus TaxID=662960 RepID=A0A940PY82_9MICO|nr:FAD-dependent oxidoreductase [Leucobacter exalbidus]MBP1326336.1 ferredoxin--NADP+ reductase [Leucobacter exalbidus]